MRTIGAIHPGEILWIDFLEPMGISKNKLATDIGVPATRIGAIVRGERSITADTAMRLARYFGTSWELWIGLQSQYDAEVAQEEHGPEYEAIQTFAR